MYIYEYFYTQMRLTRYFIFFIYQSKSTVCDSSFFFTINHAVAASRKKSSHPIRSFLPWLVHRVQFCIEWYYFQCENWMIRALCWQKTILTSIGLIFPRPIRPFMCAVVWISCAGCRIEFFIQWLYFWRKNWIIWMSHFTKTDFG